MEEPEMVPLEDVVVDVLRAVPRLSIGHARDHVAGFAALDYHVPLDHAEAMRVKVRPEHARHYLAAITDPANNPY